MEVTLLGTGSADGWPNPFCTCASCTAERSAGRLRGQTSALVDGVLLLDCGPETPRAAERAGASLADLRHVLLTHQHPDHVTPAFLLYRSWVDDGPLDVVGPPDVIEACRMWVAPDAPVRFVPVSPGDRLTLSSYDVLALPARHGAEGSTVLYDVRSPTGRLLYATDTGPLPEETIGAGGAAMPYDLVLLEETFGDRIDHGTDHLDLVTFPEQLRRLRATGAVTDATDVVAVHLSHRNPPTPELQRRLAAWGARAGEDGERVVAGAGLLAAERAASGGRARRELRTLVLGGARSGKSREAERLLAATDDVTYVATSHPDSDDPDWQERVRLHRGRRPASWHTAETLGLVSLLDADGGPLLVDCLALWLARIMDAHGAWDRDVWEATAQKAVTAEIDALVEAWRRTGRRVVAVSNEVGQGVVPATEAGVRFRDLMGVLNARVAAATEDVRWCVAGRVTSL